MVESLVAAGALDQLGGHRAQLVQGLDEALREAQLLQQELEVGQASLFGEGPGTTARPAVSSLVDVPPWSEQERLAKEKEVLGFFISGHPLERYRAEVEVFGSRTTATLGEWSEHQVTLAAVITQVKRQISKKTGKEYARLILEDFHGTAEAIVFPESWSQLNQVVKEDLAVLLTGGYSARDRGEERAPFVIESARPLEELMASGALGLALRWRLAEAPRPATCSGRRWPCAESTPVPPRSILNGATGMASASGRGPGAFASPPMKSWCRASGGCSGRRRSHS